MDEIKLTQVGIRIPEDMAQELRHHCIDEKITVTDFIKNAIRKELKEN